MKTIATRVMPIEQRETIEVRGTSPELFLNNYCTADLSKLPSGELAETFFPTEKGRILAHGHVEHMEASVFVSGYPGLAAALLPHLAKYAIFADVSIDDVTASWASILVVGPDASELMRTAISQQHGEHESVITSHRTYESLDGSTRIRCPVDAASRLRESLLASGAVDATLDEATFERISAGVPIVGQDVTNKNLVQEAARTKLAVSFTKGCYLGQEPIARLDAMGHTNRELRTIRIFAKSESCVGQAVEFNGQSVGEITSAACVHDETAALAVVRKSACPAGTKVVVGDNEGTISGAENQLQLSG